MWFLIRLYSLIMLLSALLLVVGLIISFYGEWKRKPMAQCILEGRAYYAKHRRGLWESFHRR